MQNTENQSPTVQSDGPKTVKHKLNDTGEVLCGESGIATTVDHKVTCLKCLDIMTQPDTGEQDNIETEAPGEQDDIESETQAEGEIIVHWCEDKVHPICGKGTPDDPLTIKDARVWRNREFVTCPKCAVIIASNEIADEQQDNTIIHWANKKMRECGADGQFSTTVKKDVTCPDCLKIIVEQQGRAETLNFEQLIDIYSKAIEKYLLREQEAVEYHENHLTILRDISESLKVIAEHIRHKEKTLEEMLAESVTAAPVKDIYHYQYYCESESGYKIACGGHGFVTGNPNGVTCEKCKAVIENDELNK